MLETALNQENADGMFFSNFFLTRILLSRVVFLFVPMITKRDKQQATDSTTKPQTMQTKNIKYMVIAITLLLRTITMITMATTAAMLLLLLMLMMVMMMTTTTMMMMMMMMMMMIMMMMMLMMMMVMILFMILMMTRTTARTQRTHDAIMTQWKRLHYVKTTSATSFGRNENVIIA